jgi:hypothetical protein
VTGEDGQFAFAGLAVGKFQLSASHRGYLSQSYQEHGGFSTAVAVGPGLSSEDLVFRLTPQSIVFGMISDEAGEPIRRAQVRLFAGRGPDGNRSLAARQAAMTDDLGKYELAEIPPGNYFLVVTAQPWYARGIGLIRRVEPAEGAAEQAPDSPLNLAYPTTFYPNATDSDEAAPIPLRGGERLEVNLTLSPQHAMRLRIPAPREGANFNISLTQSLFGQPEPVVTGRQSNQGGVLEVDGVLPGRYDVTLIQYGEGPNTTSSTHFTADVAAGATTLNPDLTEEEATVTGKVSGLDGKLPNAGITLFSRHPLRNYYAPLADSGEFSMKVPPGEYEVIGRLDQMYLARVASANAPVQGRMVEVKSGASPVLEIVAGKGFGHIDGFVTAGSRRPGGVLVLLAPEDARNNEILFRRDQSDSDGSFSLYDVVPGRYRLLAIEDGWDLDWSDPEVLRALEKKSVPLQVHAGETKQTMVEMQTK